MNHFRIAAINSITNKETDCNKAVLARMLEELIAKDLRSDVRRLALMAREALHLDAWQPVAHAISKKMMSASLKDLEKL